MIFKEKKIMLDWFVWKGVRSYQDPPVLPANDPYAVHALTMPSIVRMDERLNTVQIPGRSGDLILQQGAEIYNSLPISVSCIIDDPFDLDGSSPLLYKRIANVSRWLKGRGDIQFANRPYGFYKGRITNQISFGRTLRDNPHRSFSINWVCNPFFYLNSGLTPEAISLQTYSEGTKTLNNLGNVRSLPKIDISFNHTTIVEEAEITMQFGDNEAFSVEIPVGINRMVIDSDEMSVYSMSSGSTEKTLRGTFMGTLEWPYLDEGGTVVSWSCSSNFEKNGTILNIYPNWRVI